MGSYRYDFCYHNFNYHGYTTTLVVNEKLQEVGKTDLIKEAKFQSEICNIYFGQHFFSMVFIKNIQKKPNA